MLVTLIADGPAAVVAMRQMLISDPTPMAKALVLPEDADDDITQTAYAVAGAAGLEATAGGVSTALLRYAVGSGAVLDGADGVADERADQVVEAAHQRDAAGVLDGEAWLVLPTWQLVATRYSTPTQRPATRPIRIVLGDAVDQVKDDADDVGDFVREHDDQVPVEHWYDGQPMLLPAKRPSRRAQTEAAVQAALTNLTNPTSVVT